MVLISFSKNNDLFNYIKLLKTIKNMDRVTHAVCFFLEKANTLIYTTEM
jgi:hypothetical protein